MIKNKVNEKTTRGQTVREGHKGKTISSLITDKCLKMYIIHFYILPHRQSIVMAPKTNLS